MTKKKAKNKENLDAEQATADKQDATATQVDEAATHTEDEAKADVVESTSVEEDQAAQVTTTATEQPTSNASVKSKLDSHMAELQAQNPMASWKNLLLGVIVVLLVIASSLVYFNRLAANAIVEDVTKDVEMNKQTTESDKAKDQNNTKKNTTTDTTNDTDAQTNVEQNTKQTFTTVLEGEGLWNVAERVCQNGEKYTTLAEANGLPPESAVNPGQRLLVKCD